MKRTLLVLILVVYSFSAYAYASDPEKPAERTEGPERIAVLPFDNFTKEADAVTKIMPALRQRLNDRGLEVIDEDELADFLCDRRIRVAGYISKKIARDLSDELKARTILAGSFVSFRSEGIPRIGILARLIDSSTGVVLWADYVSVSGYDYNLAFGLGTVRTMGKLIPKALDELFASFSTEKSRKNTESVYRIALMPFKNRSGTPNAGIITTYMFLVELLKDPKFEPVEYGEIRRLTTELKIKSKGELAYRSLKALSENLGTYLVLLGSVDDYSDKETGSSMPRVGIAARLLDARDKRILWYNSVQSSGEEDTVAFEWGRIRHVDELAYRAVSRLVEKMGSSKWH